MTDKKLSLINEIQLVKVAAAYDALDKARDVFQAAENDYIKSYAIPADDYYAAKEFITEYLLEYLTTPAKRKEK